MSKRCIYCDYSMSDSDRICPSCGKNQDGQNTVIDSEWDKMRLKRTLKTSVKSNINPHLIAILITAVICIPILIFIVCMRDRPSTTEQTSPKGNSISQSASNNKPQYSIGISDKYILETEKGDYIFVVSYVFENNSGSPQSMAWKFNDQVFLDGIECDHSYNDYNGTDTNFIAYAQKSDEIVSGKSVKINVGYKLKKYNPDEDQKLMVRVSELFHDDSVVVESDFNISEIRVTTEKG